MAKSEFEKLKTKLKTQKIIDLTPAEIVRYAWFRLDNVLLEKKGNLETRVNKTLL
jgi:hypothetical protein